MPSEKRQRGASRKIASSDFRTVYARGRKAVGVLSLLFYLESEEKLSFAAVASKKTGRAVQRNRARRLLREAFRSHRSRMQGGGSLIAVARRGIHTKSMQEVADDMETLLTRLNLVTDPKTAKQDQGC